MKHTPSFNILRAALLTLVLALSAVPAFAQNNSSSNSSDSTTTTTTTRQTTTQPAGGGGGTTVSQSVTRDYTWAWVGGIAALAIIIIAFVAMSRRSGERA